MSSPLKPVSDRAYPFWPPPGPRQGDGALTMTVRALVRDLSINQSPSGRNTEIPVVQRPLPRQAKATGPGSTTLESRGQYGTTLYDSFMAPYEKKGGEA